VEFVNSCLRIERRWEGKRKMIGSQYTFGIVDTVTKAIDDDQNVEYMSMLDVLLPMLAKKHGLRLVNQYEASALEAMLDVADVEHQAGFKHFAPARPNQQTGQPHISNEDLQKASWVNACFVFQKMARRPKLAIVATGLLAQTPSRYPG
jgi:hypothetical protein